MSDTPIKVTREQILEASKGMLQKQFYMVHSTATNGLGPIMQNLPAHLEHQCKMEQEGIMLAAGPHWTDDEKEWLGDGTFVIRAKSLAHAKEIAAADPMHKAGARSFAVRPWLINEGGFTLRVTFADGKFKLE
ncbi:MAG: YciI family protein [Variovorax sp.]